MQYKIAIVSILTSLINFQAYGKCPLPVNYLTENSPSPCEGYLFTKEAEFKARVAWLERESYKQEILLKEEVLKKYQLMVQNEVEINRLEREKTKLWEKQAKENNKALTNMLEARNSRDWLYFLGGALTTGLLVWAVK